jgi:hypothetical protein
MRKAAADHRLGNRRPSGNSALGERQAVNRFWRFERISQRLACNLLKGGAGGQAYDKNSGQYLGRIDDDQLGFLMDNLEEESLTDADYYINRATLSLLKEKGMSQDLARMLEGILGESDELEVRYQRD